LTVVVTGCVVGTDGIVTVDGLDAFAGLTARTTGGSSLAAGVWTLAGVGLSDGAGVASGRCAKKKFAAAEKSAKRLTRNRPGCWPVSGPFTDDVNWSSNVALLGRPGFALAVCLGVAEESCPSSEL